jgi:hypothetical protein
MKVCEFEMAVVAGDNFARSAGLLTLRRIISSPLANVASTAGWKQRPFPFAGISTMAHGTAPSLGIVAEEEKEKQLVGVRNGSVRTTATGEDALLSR